MSLGLGHLPHLGPLGLLGQGVQAAEASGPQRIPAESRPCLTQLSWCDLKSLRVPGAAQGV